MTPQQLIKSLIVFAFMVTLVSCKDSVEYVRAVEEAPPAEVTYFQEFKYHLQCDSNNFEYNECELSRLPDNALDVTIKVYRRDSQAFCHFDESFGFVNEDIMYVSAGCRARFEIKYHVEVIK